MSDRELTPREVARELGVTVRTVQRWIAAGRLPAMRVGGRLRVSRSSLSVVGATHATSPAPIRTLLVANRGEIAARIARTAERLGMRCVVTVEPDDAPPPGVSETVAVASYLDPEAIVAAARACGAEAIHPGYGFLAESADLARLSVDAGLVWVGPPPDAIAGMGDKAAARQRVAADGVPVAPGYDGAAQDDASLSAAAARIGTPLLVKPAAGGGGKGMRVVRELPELPEALGAARREAERAFGDDRLVLERYVEHARHVEIQVLFDAAGDGTFLGERDCSTQRRSQKVVEEAPAPQLDHALRARMGAAALRAAASVGYRNAGTVEFLLADSGEFYFLEMNTRLQVEHPVTELVTGRDLVADQLAIATGASLADLGLAPGVPPPARGHAIEARLYAEDPEHGYLPATGPIAALRWPTRRGVRVDAGIAEGMTVTDRYDPMLAKVIAHGETRAQALERLAEALAETTLLGCVTNLRFVRWLQRQEPMTAGRMRTDTLAALQPPGPPSIPEAAWHTAALQLAARPPEEPLADPWAGGWRLNAPPVVRLRAGEEERSVEVPARQGEWSVHVASVRVGDAVHVDVEGRSVPFTRAPAPSVEEAVRHAADVGGDHAVLRAPMPGRVAAVRAREGASVEEHATLVVIEAMKMEHAVTTPLAGTVARVAVREGDQVQRGDLLVEVTASVAESSP